MIYTLARVAIIHIMVWSWMSPSCGNELDPGVVVNFVLWLSYYLHHGAVVIYMMIWPWFTPLRGRPFQPGLATMSTACGWLPCPTTPTPSVTTVWKELSPPGINAADERLSTRIDLVPNINPVPNIDLVTSMDLVTNVDLVPDIVPVANVKSCLRHCPQ